MYNKFVNAQAYEPSVIPAYSEEAVTQSPNFSSFEVDQEVLANLQEYSLANSLFWALAEGHACEQSARRNAMDNASKNAGDMIDRYQILFTARDRLSLLANWSRLSLVLPHLRVKRI